jgi:hypothetical protein
MQKISIAGKNYHREEHVVGSGEGCRIAIARARHHEWRRCPQSGARAGSLLDQPDTGNLLLYVRRARKRFIIKAELAPEI